MLRGQFLDTASAAWDLRGNVASQKWGVVVLQDLSDVSLPAGRGKNARATSEIPSEIRMPRNSSTWLNSHPNAASVTAAPTT